MTTTLCEEEMGGRHEEESENLKKQLKHKKFSNKNFVLQQSNFSYSMDFKKSNAKKIQEQNLHRSKIIFDIFLYICKIPSKNTKE